MNYKYEATVPGKATATFDTADESLRWAMGYVYLSPSRISVAKAVLEVEGSLSYCYGFESVRISKSRKYEVTYG
jgi:hypothetical protein